MTLGWFPIPLEAKHMGQSSASNHTGLCNFISYQLTQRNTEWITTSRKRARRLGLGWSPLGQT